MASPKKYRQDVRMVHQIKCRMEIKVANRDQAKHWFLNGSTTKRPGVDDRVVYALKNNSFQKKY